MLTLRLIWGATAILWAGLSNAKSCWKDTACTGPEEQAFPGTWDKYNYSPSSRTVVPVRVWNQGHNQTTEWPTKDGVLLEGNGTMRIFDFGQEVGGLVSLKANVCGAGRIGLAFTESLNYTGYLSDDSDNYDVATAIDGAIYTDDWTASQCGSVIEYTMADVRQRGGFRYLTLYTLAADTAEAGNVSATLESITLSIAFEPAWPNLRAYQGYFHSNDDLLNRIWYAGAYTLQTDMIPANTLRDVIPSGWAENLTLGLSMTEYPAAFVDGAKRDRTVWSGDLGLATRSVLVSTGAVGGIKADFVVLFDTLSPEYEIPFAGPPLNIYGSDSYHMAVLIGLYDYILYTADMNYITSIYANYTQAVRYIANKIDDTGMAYINGTAGWGRTAESGGHTTDGNMALYRVLVTAATMAGWMNDSEHQGKWASLAESVKTAVNTHNWDATAGAYINSNIGATVYPEDGNSMALYFNGSSSIERAHLTSAYLRTLWGSIGAVTPELPNNVVPYVEGFEIKGRLAIGETQSALDLIRLSWGWYLNNPYGTQSTMIEGYKMDGTWDYRGGASTGAYLFDGAFTSHSHGWSTGPTDALTSFVAGLQLTSPGGRTWSMAPQPGDLTHAEAGFTTPVGKFSAGWNTGHGTFGLWLNVPKDTTGQVTLPMAMKNGTGQMIQMFEVEGGNHTFVFDLY